MKKIQISPSILSADFSQLGKEIKKLRDDIDIAYKLLGKKIPSWSVPYFLFKLLYLFLGVFFFFWS